MKVVKPPAASARDPVPNPSQSVRPGSLKCTCGSIPPGKRCSPRAVDLLAASASTTPTAAMTPSETATSARVHLPGVTTSAPRTISRGRTPQMTLSSTRAVPCANRPTPNCDEIERRLEAERKLCEVLADHEPLLEAVPREPGRVEQPGRFRGRTDQRVVVGAHLVEAPHRVAHARARRAPAAAAPRGGRARSSVCSRPPNSIPSPSRWK